MPVLRLPLLYISTQGKRHLLSSFDSGVNLSYINPVYLDQLEIPILLRNSRIIYSTVAGHFIEITHRVALDFYIDDILLSDEFLVAPLINEEAIIGAATLQKWRIKLDFEHDTVHVDPKVARPQLKKIRKEVA